MADYTTTYSVEVEGNRIAIGTCSICGAAVVRGGSNERDVKGHDLHQAWHGSLRRALTALGEWRDTPYTVSDL